MSMASIMLAPHNPISLLGRLCLSSVLAPAALLLSVAFANRMNHSPEQRIPVADHRANHERDQPAEHDRDLPSHLTPPSLPSSYVRMAS
mgnify:CR=1 FL=1